MMSKRDVSYDIDLPMVRWWFRQGRHHAPAAIDGLNVDKLNDQHAYLSVPRDADLQVGDCWASTYRIPAPRSISGRCSWKSTITTP